MRCVRHYLFFAGPGVFLLTSSQKKKGKKRKVLKDSRFARHRAHKRWPFEKGQWWHVNGPHAWGQVNGIAATFKARFMVRRALRAVTCTAFFSFFWRAGR